MPAARETWVSLFAALCVGAALSVAARSEDSLPFSFTDVAAQAGLTATTVCGGREKNRYLLESIGSGAAFVDFDNDGWLDAFLVIGKTLEGSRRGGADQPPLPQPRERRFEDVTARAGVAASGWGYGVCAGDYDNDGHLDLYVTEYGQSRLYRNRGATFEQVTPGRATPRRGWAGGPGASSSISTTTATSTSSSRTTSTRPDDVLVPQADLDATVGPRRCWPPGLAEARTCTTGTAATARSMTSPNWRASRRRRVPTGSASARSTSTGTADRLYVANDSNPHALPQQDGRRFEISAVAAGCATAPTAIPRPAWGSRRPTTTARLARRLHHQLRRRHLHALRQQRRRQL